MRALFTALFAFAFAFAAQAQETAKPFIRTSLVAGLGASQIDGDEIAGYTKPGIIAGAAARFGLTEKLGFQPELLYAQKGSRSTDNQQQAGLNTGTYIRWRVNYIDIPVLITYEFLPRFSLLGGASAGYLLSAKLDNGGGFVDESGRFNTLDFNYLAGLEYEFADNIALNMRLEYSLTPITKQTPSFYNNTIAVSLRFYLN